jgi:DNA-binding transcriptional ArsR family regulator
MVKKSKKDVLAGIGVNADDLQDPKAVCKAAASMPSDDALIDLSEAFKVFGDSTRVRILAALSYGELCVNDLSALLRMSQSAISHQLKVLRSANLVTSRKEGKVAYYKLDDQHVNAILAIGMEHVVEKRS